jgi:chemotaxis protein methyltransferase CheR
MNTVMAGSPSRDYGLSDAEFIRIRELVKSKTGISLSDAKRDLVYGRLSKRLRALSLASFSAYCDCLDADKGEETENFINAITTNLTSFFRESHHFDYLRDTVIPDLLNRNRSTKKIRIWSAGCSTGEEPYSIAISVREALKNHRDWDVRILATDLDSNCVATGQQGVYDLERVEQLDPALLRRWFRKGSGTNLGKVATSSELKQLISFRQLNLMGDWPMAGKFDVLFCRNVIIYFDKPTQRVLFDRFAKILAPTANLFLGHSESLHNVCSTFELIGKTQYEVRPQ